MNRRIVAVVGNPNSGKTTLFNGLTGSDQEVGNWPGVTVEKIEGLLSFEGREVRVVDLPGIYSLSAYSEDERITRDYLLSGEAELIIDIIDATNLERNLYLTCQLLELKKPLLVVLNMMDLAEKKGFAVDAEHLARHLACPVVAVSAREDKDLDRVRLAVHKALDEPAAPEVPVEYPDEIEAVLSAWKGSFAATSERFRVDDRFVALKILEGDALFRSLALEAGEISREEIDKGRGRIRSILNETADEVIADAKYGFIHGITRDVLKKKLARHSLTETADAVIMHRFWSLPIFFVAMYLVFWVTINIGGAFIDFFDILFGTFFVDGPRLLLERLGSPVWLVTLLSGGIGAGIQTVSTFIPIIFTMFFALSILEDSGYMARAAFIMDRFMRILGLPGKSFVPMLVGFGCTVPAILGTRTLENRKDRYLTIFMTPFMSCGARLPVYAFFAAVFFGTSGGTMVFSLYLVGIAVAAATGFLLKRFLFVGEVSHFIMELPPYHVPRMKHILIHTWGRLKIFILRAGKIITLSVVVLGFLNSLGTDLSFGNEHTEKSLLAGIGKAVTPLFAPMGIEAGNWPAAVALFSGIFAKEAVVGTLASLYSQNNGAGGGRPALDPGKRIAEAFASIPEGLNRVFSSLFHPFGLGYSRGGAAAAKENIDQQLFALVKDNFPEGKPQAFAYLLFVLLYLPCVAALGAAMKEMGPLLGLFMAVYSTLLAWIVATLYYQIAHGGNPLGFGLALALLAGLILFLKAAGPGFAGGPAGRRSL